MEKLDLHGKTHEEAKYLVVVFVENNIDNLPIQITTGNSGIMKNIVIEVARRYNLEVSPKTYYNLGCLIVNSNE